jgi:hypothetical protein
MNGKGVGNMYSEQLKRVANELEKLRLGIYQETESEEFHQEVDDELFSLQSQVRSVAEKVSWYE